jgi:thiamine-monophosphate kinase
MEIAENKLLEKIVPPEKIKWPILRGIGDDGAVIDIKDGPHVFAQDALVEGIHFDLSFQKPFDVGIKAININVSDILAMGAEPLYFMATIGIPNEINSSQIMELYRGIKHAGKTFGLSLIGGDTVATNKDLFLDISMVGKLIVHTYLGRDKALESDLIGITGPLGESAYGLELLKRNPLIRSNKYTARYRRAEPPYSIWKSLVDTAIPNAMMDISDGLLIDLERMMKESRKMAVIDLERIPMPSILKKNSKQMLALSGGEDYQFLFTFSRSHLTDVKGLQTRFPCLSIIGEVKKGKGVHLFDHGKKIEAPRKGYQHFQGSVI